MPRCKGPVRYATLSSEQLICSCADSGDADAWAEFISRFQRPISLSVLRIAYQWGQVPRQVVDDLVQETYLKLCANECRLLRDFAVQHPEAISGYIKTIAVNVAHDHFKSLYSQKRGAAHAHESLADIDPRGQSESFGGQDAIEHEILLKQIDRCLEACSTGPDQERDRLIFWLYYQQGMSAKAIAALPTVCLTAKGVESAIFRLTHLVREQVVHVRSEPSNAAEPGEKGFRPAESY